MGNNGKTHDIEGLGCIIILFAIFIGIVQLINNTAFGPWAKALLIGWGF